ncbi:MAG: hypothetical protein JXR64_06985 [Spirochaetales bacterium]|nr:hypothetical protein [Spirochaetales bacterium]
MRNPIVYQGKHKSNNYFEGWYFKFVNNMTDKVFAVIPGISKNSNDPHCFIQINSYLGESEYYRFDIKEFKCTSSGELEINIGDNNFSTNEITLNLPHISGNIKLTNNIKYKGFWPNIMGPFSFIPFMQCYHGVVSLNCITFGSLKINNEEINFDNGKGYIEKDWGSGFPSEWLWLQGNSFEEVKTSVMLSLAHIPWLGNYFPGFLGFLNVGGKTYYFSTYNNSKIKKVVIDDFIEIDIKKGSYILSIKTKSTDYGTLKAPVNGVMNRPIKESVNGKINIQLTKNNEIIYNGSSKAVGLEVVGDIEKLFN